MYCVMKIKTCDIKQIVFIELVAISDAYRLPYQGIYTCFFVINQIEFVLMIFKICNFSLEMKIHFLRVVLNFQFHDLYFFKITGISLNLVKKKFFEGNKTVEVDILKKSFRSWCTRQILNGIVILFIGSFLTMSYHLIIGLIFEM